MVWKLGGKIMSNINIAIGLGFGILDEKSSDKNIVKIFYQVFSLQSENPEGVSDFIQVCREVFGYSSGSKTYSFEGFEIDYLKEKFKNHICTLKFLDTTDFEKYSDLTYLTIMDYNSKTSNIFEECLKGDIENCRKNPHYQDKKFNVYVGKT